jgi:hypothetical protein
MSEVAGPEAGQTACFALSCLVTEEDGHALVLGSPSLPSLLDALLYRLQTEDQDSAWFAAMYVCHSILHLTPKGLPPSMIKKH